VVELDTFYPLAAIAICARTVPGTDSLYCIFHGVVDGSLRTMAESEEQMNKRQAFALAHPINEPDDLDLLLQLSEIRTIHGGNTLCVVLAIDR
jgi:hypothetical protein